MDCSVRHRPAPRIHSSSALYRLADGRWKRTDVLHLGDCALLTLRFFREQHPDAPNTGWDRPAARVTVFRDGVTEDEAQILHQSRAMSCRRLPNGYTRFSLHLHVGTDPESLGSHEVLFHVTNGVGAVGVYLVPKVRVLPAGGGIAADAAVTCSHG